VKIRSEQERAEVFTILLSRLEEAGKAAIEFLGDLEREDFLNDKLRQSAVAQALGTFGETVRRLAELFPELPAKYPGIEWRKIKGLRNRIVHEYFSVDFDLVYEVVKTELPEDLLRFRHVELD
jgi:uncharacterized protein with HEPN domain